ncbi:mannose-6-phosphate isomerase-like protein (cupin superfamily) [Bradyrhizobium sp. F1.4.3]|uniref:cupin domain-containing protein n=1 Tax=Bradyrhizobium sp. F1.4.3 TaxID=3156356 RepID=UPI00339257AC
MDSIEHCRFDGQLYAIIVRASFRQPGITFFSPPELSQQLAFMSHPQGKSIAPHRHNKVTREVHYTQEVLFIQKGKLQVDFYTVGEEYLESRVLCPGDVILLCSGAHGFRVLEPIEMLEIKQGPYSGENDKTRFDEAAASEIRIKGPGL